MTLEEFVELNKAKIRLLEDRELNERLGVVACNRVSALVKRRVFSEGEAQDGSKIGSYSTKEGWFTTNTPGLPKLSPKGKGPKPRAKKTVYQEQGYKGFRTAVGRQSSYVDLNLTGSLFRSVGVGQGRGGTIAFGIKNDASADIMQGHEEKYSKIIATPNAQEIESAHDDVREELAIILRLN